MRKMMKGIVAVLAVSALMAGSALAADKLRVRNDGDTADIFKVDGAGLTTGTTGRFGIGTLAPPSTLSVVDETSAGTRGLAVYQHSTDIYGPVVDFRKSQGSAASKIKVASGDFVGAFHGRAWDGAAWKTGATINFMVDGTPGVGNGGVPIALLLSTGSNDDALSLPKTPRMRIGSNGQISVGNGNTAAITSGNGIFDINSDVIRMRQSRTPGSSSATCYQGEIAWDANYIYVCITDNSWRRTALSTSTW